MLHIINNDPMIQDYGIKWLATCYVCTRFALDKVTLYSAKLRNPTQVATMTTALDLGVFQRSEEKVLQSAGYYKLSLRAPLLSTVRI
jgi:hypothetical protein